VGITVTVTKWQWLLPSKYSRIDTIFIRKFWGMTQLPDVYFTRNCRVLFSLFFPACFFICRHKNMNKTKTKKSTLSYSQVNTVHTVGEIQSQPQHYVICFLPRDLDMVVKREDAKILSLHSRPSHIFLKLFYIRMTFSQRYWI
jgi:hypothetical protein